MQSESEFETYVDPDLSLDHVMIDLETLGTKPGSVIASIGAVRFNPKAGVQTAEELVKNSVSVNVNIQSQLNLSMTIDAGTMLWWMKQSEGAVKSTFFDPGNTMLPGHAALKLAGLFKTGKPQDAAVDWKPKDLYVWGNGADFDIALLGVFMDKTGIRTPWKYTKVRCFRTINNCLTYDHSLVPDNELPHNALADAVYQAQVLQAIHQANPGLKL